VILDNLIKVFILYLFLLNVKVHFDLFTLFTLFKRVHCVAHSVAHCSALNNSLLVKFVFLD
jgi:hypothetical protein